MAYPSTHHLLMIVLCAARAATWRGGFLDSPCWQPVRWNGLAAAASCCRPAVPRVERELEMETAGVSGNLRWALTPAALQFQAPPWLHMLKTTASGRPHITARSLDCIGWLCTKKRKRTSRHLPVSLSQLVNCLSRIQW